MKPECTIQLYASGHWHDVANVALFGAQTLGWQAPTYSGYATEWAVEHTGRRDAWALCSQFPVSLAPLKQPHWPVFLIDMLPQGFGRAELLRQLNLSATAEAIADWPLLLSGAGNPIGNLRVKEAAQWLDAHPCGAQGFSDDEVAARSDDFMEYLAQHGLFVAGSSGVQGEWPKILLTRAKDGRLYLDHTLPDHESIEHYIVKFGRGADERLASILRNEAPYMDVATHLGLRVQGPLTLRERALFIPRFDRAIDADGQFIRLGQESLATFMELAGFGVVPTHDDVCVKLASFCTHPESEVIEYLRRDVANLAFGNKDNHARNTALQRGFNGDIRLTPVFDFAPMYLHPDGIGRRIRWLNKEVGGVNWNLVLDAVAGRCGLDRQNLVTGLQGMIPKLREIAENGIDFGLESAVLSHVRPSIISQVESLENLR